MKKGKIFTNCLFSIWTLSVILSFASCSSDGDSISIIDERVPLETEAPFSVILKAYSENSDITAKGDVKALHCMFSMKITISTNKSQWTMIIFYRLSRSK